MHFADIRFRRMDIVFCLRMEVLIVSFIIIIPCLQKVSLAALSGEEFRPSSEPELRHHRRWPVSVPLRVVSREARQHVSDSAELSVRASEKRTLRPSSVALGKLLKRDREFRESTTKAPYEMKDESTAAAPLESTPEGLLEVQERFVNWVSYIGSLRHSIYGVAKNQIVERKVLIVDPRRTASSPDRFITIQSAIDAVPENNLIRTKILIAPGIYTEKVLIPYNKPFITLEGSNTETTIIQWSDAASKMGADNNPIGTFRSATVAVDAPYFIARNITFKNTAPIPMLNSNDSQAVAMRISGDASIFLGCRFYGAQDTLYDHKGRHYFQDCYVEGSVDFIFGYALSMYRNCHLHAIGAPYQAVTAQRRDNASDDSGFSFVNCKVTGSGPVYLGRAWGAFSRVIFSFTYMDSIVLPKGWNDWNDPNRQLTVFFGQFRCYGPGANQAGRVSWSKELTLQQAKPFIDVSFIDGNEWSPY
ncbi:hypothetical protein KP509_24G024700 [Ceratopteris richardii]|uniref:Pectinesterase n=1 Tax=Ceratopteris richardii TaxID=49495 RepID=A0A8T2RUV5_CERRI|nr:hypothetical protein KP509_24G024700 [Ceratopteris richardii]